MILGTRSERRQSRNSQGRAARTLAPGRGAQRLTAPSGALLDGAERARAPPPTSYHRGAGSAKGRERVGARAEAETSQIGACFPCNKEMVGFLVWFCGV